MDPFEALVSQIANVPAAESPDEGSAPGNVAVAEPESTPAETATAQTPPDATVDGGAQAHADPPAESGTPSPDVAAATPAEPESPSSPPEPQLSEAELAELRAKSAELEGIQARLAAAEEARQVQAIRSKVTELADQDPLREQGIYGLLAAVATPLHEARQKAEVETQNVAKTLATFHRVATAHIPKEQMAAIQADFERVIGLETFQLVDHSMNTIVGDRQRSSAEVERLKRENAELAQQLAASREVEQRTESRADAVPGVGGGGSVPEAGSRDHLKSIVGNLFDPAA